jgi:hypothetical protein
MSHFVQRLLVRHMGPVSQGAAGTVMMPRVASRFEGVASALETEHGAADVLRENVVGPPAVAAPALARPRTVTPNTVAAPQAVQPALNIPMASEIPRRDVVRPQTSVGNDRVSKTVVTVRETSADRENGARPGAPAASAAPPTLAERNTVGVAPEVSSLDEGVQPEPLVARAQQQQQTVEREARAVVPSLQSAPEALTATGEATPPPQISIGRIDVQFLPPVSPPVAQRPVVQRTRGFDAYANARRGLVR